MHVVVGIKVAIDKSVKDRGGEPIHWRSHIIPLEQYSQPQAGGRLATNECKLLD